MSDDDDGDEPAQQPGAPTRLWGRLFGRSG